MTRRIFCLALLLCTVTGISRAETFLTELRERGYSLIPAPQEVRLDGGDAVLDETWAVEAPLGAEHFLVRWFTDHARAMHGVEFGGAGNGRIVLRVARGTVKEADTPGLNGQGYRLRISGSRVELFGETEQGLFHGVQSLLQLMRRDSNGRLVLPSGEILDWPDLEMRMVHWDTKHHQKRPAAIKSLLDRLAVFKVNAVAFEMEDKYEFPSHPEVGAPGAYTKEQMHEFTRYAAERHIQLVPLVQAPAHMTYVLKHPKFAHLKAKPTSNYQACMCDEEAISLILDLYQDMIDATPGVDYFHVSTDEVYYAGICDKCEREYNERNRSLYWVEYVRRVHEWMAERGRRMLAWVEYPLLADDIPMLPPDIIDAIMVPNRSDEWIDRQKQIGMQCLAYASMQGSEYLFPNLFPTEYRGRYTGGRLTDAASTPRAVAERGANVMGTFCASWDDAGLHEETFWLGWASVSQYGWTMDTPSVEQNTADFMDVFYGRGAGDMVEVFKLLESGARFFEDGWDVVKSTERGQAWGSSRGPFSYDRRDQTLLTPPLPSPEDLRAEPEYTRGHDELIEQARLMREENHRLLALLHRELGQVERNRYSLEVFISLAELQRHFIRTVLALAEAEQSIRNAAAEHGDGDPATAVRHLVEAGNTVKELLEQGSGMWNRLTATWEKSRFPKNRTVDGREFLHVMDDVKDHFADRRKGLDYMIAPFQRMDLDGWHGSLVSLVREYAKRNNVPVQGLEVPRLED